MKVAELTDYLVNNDFEIQIIKGQYGLVEMFLKEQGIKATPFQVRKAMSAAREDYYIQNIEQQMYPKNGN